MQFIKKIKQKARENKKTIVLPETNDIRVLTAANIAMKEDIANIVLVGNKGEILKLAQDINLDKAIFIDPNWSEKFLPYANEFYNLRKDKGMTLELSKSILLDPVHFGMMMVKQNEADGLVSGAIHTTADTLRPALQIIKMKPDTKLVSTFFIVEIPDCKYGENGIFLFADCALNENPTEEQLSEIAISSAKSMKEFTDTTPIVAMLSYSTLGSASSEMTQKVRNATSLAKQKMPELLIEGEIQLDAAIVEKVAKIKLPNSTVAGKANVLIFPDLNSGNIGYKLVERFANGFAYGPITQGLARPVNDLSRGCSAEDIVGVIACTVVQAQ